MKACSSCIRAAALWEVDEVCKEIINQSKGTGQSWTTVEKTATVHVTLLHNSVIPSEHPENIRADFGFKPRIKSALPVSPSTDSEMDVYRSAALVHAHTHTYSPETLHLIISDPRASGLMLESAEVIICGGFRALCHLTSDSCTLSVSLSLSVSLFSTVTFCWLT